jgi:hypothetical protein
MLGGTSRSGQPQPLTGTISFMRDGRVVATAEAGMNGIFARTLHPRVYQVRGCTSKIQMVNPDGSHLDTCASSVQAKVLANHTTVVDIPSFIVP